jgi:hypothetical protein
MWNLLIKINKKLTFAIPIMMLAGFMFGISSSTEMVRQLKALILPLTFLMGLWDFYLLHYCRQAV